jgi:hypothetical protein
MQLTQVMAKAIHEPEFRPRFMENPKVILDEMNIPIPTAQNVTVLESREGEIVCERKVIANEYPCFVFSKVFVGEQVMYAPTRWNIPSN